MLFKNITKIDYKMDVINNMFVKTEGDRITYIGKDEPESKDGEIYDGNGKLLMSGFYNAHAHSAMTLMRGYGENLGLQAWLETKIFPFEAKLDSNAVYWGTLLAMAESLSFGNVSSTGM